jgi:exodeoxyribonuclease V alpha subunit
MLINIEKEPIHDLLASQIQPAGGYLSKALALAYTQGHTALRFNKEKLFPSLELIFTNEGREYLTSNQISFLEKSIIREIEGREYRCCIQKDNFIALPRAYGCEEALFREIERLSRGHEKGSFEVLDRRLNDEQTKAVLGALRYPFSAITGGPGTGKTFTAGLFLKSLLQNKSKAFHVVLLAPTGRAVKNAYQSMCKSLDGYLPATFEAKTIHRALSEPGGYLPYNVVIIDESSMIDSLLFLRLLKRLYIGTKVVLLGDKNQLPPIDPGSPFTDLINQTSPLFPSFSLKACLRTDREQFLQLAYNLLEYNEKGFFEILRDRSGGVEVIDLDEKVDLKALLQREIFDPWNTVKTDKDAQELLAKVVLLTAARRGNFGADMCNALGSALVHSQFQPVISTKNSYQLRIMNGDMGAYDRYDKIMHFREISVPAILCPNAEIAYAMTVHKSQGSEFNTVLFVLMPKTVIDIKMLYTAITRAKDRLILAVSFSALKKIFLSRSNRETVLPYFLSRSR